MSKGPAPGPVDMDVARASMRLPPLGPSGIRRAALMKARDALLELPGWDLRTILRMAVYELESEISDIDGISG